MRPLTLRMKNFGPFEDETVDFTKPKPMFLITGKTGSGKSRIFDAMTYALYGKYSAPISRIRERNHTSNSSSRSTTSAEAAGRAPTKSRESYLTNTRRGRGASPQRHRRSSFQRRTRRAENGFRCSSRRTRPGRTQSPRT